MPATVNSGIEIFKSLLTISIALFILSTLRCSPTRLKKWSDAELIQYLQTGITTDGDSAADPMSEVISNSLAKLTTPDVNAVVGYLRSLLPLPEEK